MSRTCFSIVHAWYVMQIHKGGSRRSTVKETIDFDKLSTISYLEMSLSQMNRFCFFILLTLLYSCNKIKQLGIGREMVLILKSVHVKIYDFAEDILI